MGEFGDIGINVYEVEKVLDKRLREDRVEYLLKWAGYEDPADDAWVPAEKCYCTHLINEFEKPDFLQEPPKTFSNTPWRRLI